MKIPRRLKNIFITLIYIVEEKKVTTKLSSLMMKMSDDKNKTILSQSVGLFIADVK
jgi:hypothetical protein